MAMDDTRRTVLTGSAFTAAQTFVAGVSSQKKRELASDLGRKEFGFAHEEFEDESGFYEGTFKVKVRNGVGVLTEAHSGSTYHGQFLHDKKHNHGLQVWGDQSTYDGQWEHGAKHGQGSYKSITSTYDGRWEDGLRHGYGKQVYSNGDEFEGTWWKGQCSGPGVYYHADGSEYHGGWATGKRHGAGMYFGSRSQKEQHLYQQGILVQRKVLLPGSKPPRGQRAGQPLHCDKLLQTQKQLDMLTDTVFNSFPHVGHLCVKDSAVLDLSAPSIRREIAAANVAEMKGGLVGLDDASSLQEISMCESGLADNDLGTVLGDSYLSDMLLETVEPLP
mmetsp:Transcript_44911/g.83821  ORF Transcript_44911/g.83821 Transcript_44911/m.83821 type:complete len:332 (+) Transcript_44911:48-1043(+)